MKKAGLRPAFLLISQDKIANSNKRDISLSRFPFLLYSFFTTLLLPYHPSLPSFPYYLALPAFPALTSFPLSPFSSLFSLLLLLFPYYPYYPYYPSLPSFPCSSLSSLIKNLLLIVSYNLHFTLQAVKHQFQRFSAHFKNHRLSFNSFNLLRALVKAKAKTMLGDH